MNTLNIKNIIYIIFLTALLASCGNLSPDETFKRFVTLIDKGELTEASKLVDAPPGMEAKVSMGLNMMAKKFKTRGGIEEITINNTNIDGEKAVVEFTLHYKGTETSRPSTESSKQTFRKVEGKWMLKLL